MSRAEIASAVLALLGTSPDPAILTLAHLPYLRELAPMEVDGLLRLKLDKRGWRLYKRRCPYPQGGPPPADLEGVLRALRSAGLPAVRATDEGKFIFVYFVIEEGLR